MAQQDYDRLVDEACALKGIDREARFSEAFDLMVNDVAFTLAPVADAVGVVDALAYFCDFGPLPDGGPHALILWRLLEANLFVFGTDMPHFATNPESGHVMLIGRAPLTKLASGDKVLQLLGEMSDYATDWGRTYFLDERERNFDEDPARSGGGVGAATHSILQRAQHAKRPN